MVWTGYTLVLLQHPCIPRHVRRHARPQVAPCQNIIMITLRLCHQAATCVTKSPGHHEPRSRSAGSQEACSASRHHPHQHMVESRQRTASLRES